MDTRQTASAPAGEPAHVAGNVPAPGQPAFPVVGIGASAGGLQALSALLANLPAHPGMALVVVLHLAADTPSTADKLLQRVTAMPVVQVTHTKPILPDKVYVIPPDRSLALRGGQLVLGELDRSARRPVAIDTFFASLADAEDVQVVGVVLSGMGTDGTAGLARIREAGGATIAQLPEDAIHDSMPRSAIESGNADFVLAARDIPRKLAELRAAGPRSGRPAPAQASAADAGALETGPAAAILDEALSELTARTGQDFTYYRQAPLVRRLERRIQLRGAPDPAAYLRLLRDDLLEPEALRKTLLIGVTRFFRDQGPFDALQRSVLPALIGRLSNGRPLRAWVAACSTGEEAYSLAMLLEGLAEGMAATPEFEIFASDIDGQALHAARSGLYPMSIAREVSPERLQRYFTLEGEQYRVRKYLRDRVLFTRQDLLKDSPFIRLDLVCCRNFLIYLKPQMHRSLLQQFHFALQPGGFLLLGSAESASVAEDLFAPVDPANRIYQARPAARLASPQRARVAPLPEAPPPRRRGRLFSFGEIHLHKAAGLAPPSILLDADAEILHVAEGAVRFLGTGGGEPTRELAELVLPALQLPLRAALFQARKSGNAASSGPVRIDGAMAVEIQLLPFEDEHAEGGLILAQFLELPGEAPQPDAGLPQLQPGESSLAQQLDEELAHTRRQLADTIEQAERAGSEMRIYQEEMQTTVEELRVHAEELERRLNLQRQSNEELESENAVLRSAAAASAKAHDDLANLVASSDVATIFLDRNMCIVRFTPRITEFFNVIASDIGRPLTHISNRLDYPPLAEEVAQVFETLQAMEREVRDKQGRDYIVRVHPYRTTTDRIEGAVMTFFDISKRRAAEEARHQSEARLAAVFDSLPVGVGVLDSSGRVTLANREMQRYMPSGILPSRDPARKARWHASDAEGNTILPEDYPGARALRGERVVPGIDMLYREDDGREVWTRMAAVPVVDAGGQVAGHVAVVTDIDALKRTEAALRENERRLLALVEEFAQAVWETDERGAIVVDSPSWRAYTGQAEGEMLGQGWLEAIHPEDRAAIGRLWTEAVAQRGILQAEYRVRSARGGWRLTRVRATPLFNADGSIAKWVGMNVEVDGA